MPDNWKKSLRGIEIVRISANYLVSSIGSGPKQDPKDPRVKLPEVLGDFEKIQEFGGYHS